MAMPKLVRDNIPEIIEAQGKVPTTRILDKSEYEQRLLEKFMEEVQEVITAEPGEKRKEELADLLELIKAAAELEGSSLAEIEQIRVSKEQERGGFTRRVLLESIEEA